MPPCLLLRNIFGRVRAGVLCLSLLFPCAGQFVKYVLKCVLCESFTGLSCTGSWHCLVWPSVRDPLQAVGVTCGVAGSGDPLEQPCVLPAILEQPQDTAYSSWFALSSHENSRVAGWTTCQALCWALFLSPDSLVIYTSLLIIIPMYWDHSVVC